MRPQRNLEQAQIRYELAAKYFANHRVEAALEELRLALEADPESADAHNMLGLVALKQGHDHLMQLEASSCLKGRDAELVRADAMSRFSEAERHFKRALALRPLFAEAWNNLSVAALQQRSWDEAIVAARNALKDATYATPELARGNLGWAYYEKKDLQNAWKELHEAVSRNPGFCVGRYRLAKVYVDRGEAEQAAQILEPLLADSKRCPIQEAQLLGGLICERTRARDRARELFQRCIEMAPRSCLADECRRYAQLVK